MGETKTAARLASRIVETYRLAVVSVVVSAIALGAPQGSRPELKPIPHPDLAKLERAVADQVRLLKEHVEELAATGGVPSRDLAAAYGDLGQLYHAYELADAARACYANATLLEPADYRWHHLLGRLLESSGFLNEAAEAYRTAVRSAPRSQATWVYLGDVELQRSNSAEAAQAFETALNIDPNEAAAHNGLGELKLAQGKYVEAVGYLRRALELAPAADRIHYSLGMAYRGLGEMDKARSHLAQRGTVGVRPRDPLTEEMEDLLEGERVHLLQGRLAFNAGRFQQAADFFTEAVRSDPKSARARINLGTALGRIGDSEGAIREFRAALELDPENATARFNIGTLMVRAGNCGEAVDHLKFVVKERPEDREAARELAKCLIKLGRNDEALEVLPAVVDNNLGDEDPLFALVNLWIDRGRYGTARDLLSRAYESFPSHGRTAHALARLLATCPDSTLRNGKRAVEIATLVYSASKRLSHGETLAMALAEQGNCAEAAAVQETLIGAATKAGETQLAARLGEGLERYRKGVPCNPPALTP